MIAQALAYLAGLLLGALLPYWPLWVLVLVGLIVWRARSRA